MQIKQLADEHEELERIAIELLKVIEASEPRPVAALRWRLARTLIAHLAVEDSWLYIAVIGSRDESAAETAIAFRDEMGDLATLFRAHMAEWTDFRIASEWTAFCEETRGILDALLHRIKRENEILYPLARVALGLPEPAAPHSPIVSQVSKTRRRDAA